MSGENLKTNSEGNNHTTDNTASVLTEMPDYSGFRSEQSGEASPINKLYDKLLQEKQNIDNNCPSTLMDNVPQEAVDSFNEKFDKYKRLLNNIDDETNENEYEAVANQMLKSLDADELDYLRRLRVSLHLDCADYYDYNLDFVKQNKELVWLKYVDRGFLGTDEFRRLESKYEELTTKNYSRIIENLSPAELKLFRQQRIKHSEPIPFYGEDGVDEKKYFQNLAIKELWGADVGFEESEENKEYEAAKAIERKMKERESFKRRSEFLASTYPEIYLAGEKESRKRKNIDERLRKVKYSDIERIRQAGESFDDSVRNVVDYLSGLLNLNEKPQVTFCQYDPDGPLGTFSNDSNEVIVYYSDPPKEYVDSETINTVAHEMWHAYQYQVCEDSHVSQKNFKMAEQYNINYEHYIDGGLDYEGYYNQLVEVEARYFGEKFSNMFFGEEDNISRSIKSKMGRIARRFTNNNRESN